MTIYARNITYPDLLRTFDNNSDNFKFIDSLFITPGDYTFSEADFLDVDFWYDQLGVNIFPLHGVTDFNSTDKPTQYITSLQDFDYPANKGKYKQEFKFDWSLDYHKLVNEISGQNVNIIYASGQYLRATKLPTGEIKGFATSLFNLEKILFNVNNSQGNSPLTIELLDSDELNVSGYEVEVDWQPKRLDRKVINLNLTFSEDTIVMAIDYLQNPVTGITASDITITDHINGNITFSTFIPGGGVYQLRGFSNTITNACLYIQSRIYIGAKRFTFKVIVIIVNNMLFADGNNVVLADGNNMVLAKN